MSVNAYIMIGRASRPVCFGEEGRREAGVRVFAVGNLTSVAQLSEPVVPEELGRVLGIAVDVRDGEREGGVGVVDGGVEDVDRASAAPAGRRADIAVLADHGGVLPAALLPAGLEDLSKNQL